MAAFHLLRGTEKVPPSGSEPYWTVTEFLDMDAKFQRRMALAIRAGRECSVIGTIKTPGTISPVFVVPIRFGRGG